MVSHSPYLCSEYLSPMPNSIDTGKSPLALLEKTCISIGLPDPPGKGKSILPASEKAASVSPTSSKKDLAAERIQSKTDAKSGTDKNGNVKTNKAKDGKSENSNSVSGTDENGNQSKENGVPDPATTRAGSRPTSAPEPPSASGASTAQPVPPTIPSLPSTSRCYPTPTLPPGYSSLSLPHLGAYPHGIPFPLTSGFPGMPPMPGLPPTAAAASGYPRMCMDPTCKACPAGLGASGRSCPLGCVQCSSHPELSALWLSSAAYTSALLQQHALPTTLGCMSSVLPSLPTSVVTSAGSSTQLPGSFFGGAGSGPFCNWVTPEGLCMKRFPTSEELLQHVRTHTNSANPETTGRSNHLLNFASPMGGTGSHLSGRLSPRSVYLNALRYHPYQKLSPPGASPPGSLAPTFGPSANFAALSALYAGQRLPGSLPH